MSPQNKRKLQVYRDHFRPLLLLLALPWLWAALLVPWWVSLGSLLLVPLAALMIVLLVFPTPPAPRRAGDVAALSNAQIEKMREASAGLHNMLGRWSAVSRDTRASLEDAQQQVDDVIVQTETAVIEITNAFLGINRKTRIQMESALGLLQQTRSAREEPGQSEERDMSLPQYIRASEAMLTSLTAYLLRFSESSIELARRQERVREQTRHIDSLLDQMSAMANQVARLALNTSVMVKGANQRDFVEMTDKVRAMSKTANDLSRDVRQSLEGIRDEIAGAYAAIDSMAQEARGTARKAQVEVEQLSVGMLDKNRKVGEILDQIGTMGQEIQQDINQIIISMQFQDITQQKLQHLKGPVLTEVLKALHSIFDETRFLNQRLNKSLMETPGAASDDADDGAPAAGTPFRVVKQGAVTTVTKPGDKPVAEPKQPGAADGEVELF